MAKGNYKIQQIRQYYIKEKAKQNKAHKLKTTTTTSKQTKNNNNKQTNKPSKQITKKNHRKETKAENPYLVVDQKFNWSVVAKRKQIIKNTICNHCSLGETTS